MQNPSLQAINSIDIAQWVYNLDFSSIILLGVVILFILYKFFTAFLTLSKHKKEIVKGVNEHIKEVIQGELKCTIGRITKLEMTQEHHEEALSKIHSLNLDAQLADIKARLMSIEKNTKEKLDLILQVIKR